VAYPGREAYVKFLESIMAQQKEPISALEIETD
jgi:malate dehydrogenase (oxaloacetate-decarboxylating)(NADP+)